MWLPGGTGPPRSCSTGCSTTTRVGLEGRGGEGRGGECERGGRRGVIEEGGEKGTEKRGEDGEGWMV